MADKVVLDGELSPVLPFDGDFSLDIPLAGELGIVTQTGGGGGSAVLIDKTITANGTYNAMADSADGYSKVTVAVPASAVDTGTKSITANGTHDVTSYASADVNVPNSYSASDEGKVVDGGALVSQTSLSVTANDTYDTTTVNEVTVNVSGGASITDGVIVKSRDTDGYATEVDFYNSDGEIPQYQFGNGRANAVGGWTYGKVTKINLMDDSYAVRQNAFYYCASLVDFDFSKITSLPNSASSNRGEESQFRACKALTTVNAPNLTGAIGVYAFYECSNLETVYMPKVSELCGYVSNRGCFGLCTSLTSCQFGSVGYPVTAINNYAFNGVTQTGLTITVFTTGALADTLKTNIRNSATGATIIIKAAENTTYNGTPYSAGDTIVTSTP